MPDSERSILSSGRGPKPAEQTVEDNQLAVREGGWCWLRFTGALVGLSCVALLVAAWHLQSEGLPFGAETQLSLPVCALRERTGYPCPTCGMTRAWEQAVRGNLVEAFRANMAGAVLAVGCGLVALGGLGTAVGGRSFYDRIVRPVLGLLRPRQWLYAGLSLIVLAWWWNVLEALVKEHESLF